LIAPARSAQSSAAEPSTCCCRSNYATFAVNWAEAISILYAAPQAALAHRGVEVTTSKHGTVVSRFGQHLVNRRLLPRSLGTSLNQMLELRQKADYGGTGVTSLDAERGLSQAEAFVAAVERLIRG
jgi:uncharacterized protein (UPF0332 family)